ncbi:hypothetical protein [Streptomyces sp. NBC_01497]|uniref:hypothetical protein n=1 Tax=Streptomyces sp. NBC_01497 TaxID=2903885 RepID=UPI002E33DE9C|nr:hypothetical protein [Streptomyces sp. NBC_01497]
MNDARHGVIVDRRPSGGGLTGSMGAFIVQDEVDRSYYTFDYTHIVTEGFRTIRTGERVRFYVNAQRPDRAEFVIRLDQPDPVEYYQ